MLYLHLDLSSISMSCLDCFAVDPAIALSCTRQTALTMHHLACGHIMLLRPHLLTTQMVHQHTYCYVCC